MHLRVHGDHIVDEFFHRTVFRFRDAPTARRGINNVEGSVTILVTRAMAHDVTVRCFKSVLSENATVLVHVA